MTAITVTLVAPNMHRVAQGGRYWIVDLAAVPVVRNELGQKIDPSGTLGQKPIRAAEGAS